MFPILAVFSCTPDNNDKAEENPKLADKINIRMPYLRLHRLFIEKDN